MCLNLQVFPWKQKPMMSKFGQLLQTWRKEQCSPFFAFFLHEVFVPNLLIIYLWQIDHFMCSLAQSRVGYQAYAATPAIRKPLTTALARLTNECSQELLHLIRKQAWVKVFNFISILYNTTFMHQQNIVVQNIIRGIISKSRKNSHESLYGKMIEEKSDNSQNEEQEYIIRKSDLRQFIQKIAMENYEKNTAIEEKLKEIKLLENIVQKYEKNNHSVSHVTNLKQSNNQTEEKEKKKKEQMQLELTWSTNKIKEQMRQIEKIKQTLSVKQDLIKHLTQREKASIEKKVGNQFTTPGKADHKRLDYLHVRNCESIEYSLLNSDIINRFNERHTGAAKEYSTQITKEGNQSEPYGLYSVNPYETQQSKNLQISRLHRHAEIDQKDRFIKLLGQKCLALQAEIEKITRKYLGEVVCAVDNSALFSINSQLKKEQHSFKYSHQREKLVGERQNRLNRVGSEVELSGAFKVQSQQI